MNCLKIFLGISVILFSPTVLFGQEKYKTRRQALMEKSKDRKECYGKSKKNLSQKSSKNKACKPTTAKENIYFGEDYSVSLSSNWQCIEDKQQLPEKIDLLFIGKGTSSLTPTINIASELTPKSAEEYTEEIISYHVQDPNTFSSSKFTVVRSQSCDFIIIKTEKNSCWGQVVFLQAVTVKNRKVYLFNCMSAWDDFPRISQEFLKSVTSFQLKSGREMSGDEILEQALRNMNK